MFFLFIIYQLFLTRSSAEIKFNDMIEKHWAEDSVYKLVKLGITQGFPDGTFQGMKKINRYEVTGFISKMYARINVNPKIKKLAAELNNEYNLEKYRTENPQNLVLTVNLHSRNYFSKSTRGSDLFSNYRAEIFFEKFYSRQTGFMISLDTLDSGFGALNKRELSSEMIDFEAKTDILGAAATATIGPGAVFHSDTLIPSDCGTVFLRKDPAMNVAMTNSLFDLETGFCLLGIGSAGTTSAVNYQLKLGSKQFILPLFGQSKLKLTANLADGKTQSKIGFLEYSFNPNKLTDFKIIFGAGSLQSSGNFWGVDGKIGNLALKYYQVGSNFRKTGLNKYDLLPLNLFDKYILDGTTEIGLAYTFNLNNFWSIKLKSNAVFLSDYKFGSGYPGSSFTCEPSLTLRFNENSNVSVFYRLFKAPGGANYADPAISTAVPIREDMIGLQIEAQL